MRHASRALLPPAGREARVVPGRRRGRGVREFAGDAEASGGRLRWAIRVAVLQMGAEGGQAAEALLLPAAGAAEGEVTGGDGGGDGAAGLAVPLEEERTGTSGTQLLLHHSAPGGKKRSVLKQSISRATGNLKKIPLSSRNQKYSLVPASEREDVLLISVLYHLKLKSFNSLFI